MGCNSSKATQTVGVYRPPPSSFAVFDIDSIKEPWLTFDNSAQVNQEKPTHVPAPVLEKLNKFETDAPNSWDEVSKALQDFKPTFDTKNAIAALPAPPPPKPETLASPQQTNKPTPKRNMSFHTLEELDAKINNDSKPKIELKKAESMKAGGLKKTEVSINGNSTESTTFPAVTGPGKVTKLKDNPFILRDRQEREKEGKEAIYDKIKRFDPLNDFPEKIPPNGVDSVVIYTTSLRGVRKTYEDCNRIRSLLENNRVVFDERDVALHGGFRNELKELLSEEEDTSVPRLFVKGRYIGGVDKVSELEETGKLGRIMNWARVERGVGRQACEGCGGARFLPCLDCGGSCKVIVNGIKERCDKCNENGLMLCPACL